MPSLRKNPMQGVNIDAMETFTFIQKAGKQALAQQQLAMQRAEEAINGPAQRAKRERAQAKVNEAVRKYAHVPAMTMQQRMMQGLGMEPTTAEQGQRELRNAQSRLSKDLKASRKALATLNDSNDPTNTRRNAMRRYIMRLESLQADMKQRGKDPEGKTVTHTYKSRLAAMRDYLLGYAGAENRSKALAGNAPRYLNDAAALFEQNFRHRWGFDYTDYPEEAAGDYAMQDLYDEYEDALIAGDSDEAREVVLKINARLEDLYNW
nr:MAG TPA: hypothetical protein [Caudoviricetes sp.]